MEPMLECVEDYAGIERIKCCNNINPNIKCFTILPIFKISICSSCGKEHIDFHNILTQCFNTIYKFYLDKSKLPISLFKNKHLTDIQFDYIMNKLPYQDQSYTIRNDKNHNIYKVTILNSLFLLFGFASWIASKFKLLNYSKLEDSFSSSDEK